MLVVDTPIGVKSPANWPQSREVYHRHETIPETETKLNQTILTHFCLWKRCINMQPVLDKLRAIHSILMHYPISGLSTGTSGTTWKGDRFSRFFPEIERIPTCHAESSSSTKILSKSSFPKPRSVDSAKPILEVINSEKSMVTLCRLSHPQKNIKKNKNNQETGICQVDCKTLLFPDSCRQLLKTK